MYSTTNNIPIEYECVGYDFIIPIIIYNYESLDKTGV